MDHSRDLTQVLYTFIYMQYRHKMAVLCTEAGNDRTSMGFVVMFVWQATFMAKILWKLYSMLLIKAVSLQYLENVQKQL